MDTRSVSRLISVLTANIHRLALNTPLKQSESTGVSKAHCWRHGASCDAIHGPRAVMILFPNPEVNLGLFILSCTYKKYVNDSYSGTDLEYHRKCTRRDHECDLSFARENRYR